MSTETLMTPAATTTEGQGTSVQSGEATTVVAEPVQSSDPVVVENTEPQAGDQTDAAPPEPVVPEKYEFKPPEGVMLDEQNIAAFSEVAKDLKLTQDQAQKVIDKVAPVLAQRQQEVHKATVQAWTESTKTDKELGGDKLATNLAVANKALDQYASPELKKLLTESGLVENPEVIRMFFKVGKSISEDKFVAGGAGPQGSNTGYANALYPSK